METLTALYDACVLYPAPLRDLLMHLALTDTFRARWTDQIHEEWIRGLLAKRPDLTREQLERTRRLMNAHVRDCLVTGYESLIAGLELPDAEDRHVLAAAIHSGADVIVTFNKADFPAKKLRPFGMEAQHPDDFIIHLLDLDAEAVCAAARRHRESLRKPPKTAAEYLDCLAKQQLRKTIARLGQFAEIL